MNKDPIMTRYRITFAKRDAMCYTGHLDLQKIWMRVLLRAKLPVAYTLGFHPTPKLAFAWPLPVGWRTEGELIDIWLDGPEPADFDKDEFIERINRVTPPGLRVLDCRLMPCYGYALTTQILSSDYLVTFPESVDSETLRSRMTALMAQNEIMRERRGKPYDLKPLIEAWEISETVPAVMRIRMVSRDSAMGRPDELAAALGVDPFEADFCRMRYILQ